MTTETRTYCDVCGRPRLEGATADRWGTLTVKGGDGAPRTTDICPACIAKLRGWENPVVLGSGGARVLDLKRHPAGAGSA